ncbi:hypothetical protein Ae201684P_018779 [Aphanomyces euteiches]|uniref:AB hydrolase-1 domain-containing protein n=1 Tax=Aphanomyces euteiches TaxID=100861 RepID=A0A6G0XU42_9STRA|nr:hypothetical protein Ae201684_001300 [Aphanomyces euteiches]KAH9099769.1 hypothetical protein Ae201684P_018779 [Aphanomyces euteiches]KAH9157209.1 hypothetical protein AeRB84_000936 [Aphanomyces euteiches]
MFGLMGGASKAPIVLVCGWMNASPRGVAKYAEMFQRLGYRTIVLESHVSHLFLPRSLIHRAAVQHPLLQATNEELLLVPHMISNGGCLSWTSVQDHLTAEGVRFKVPAMIFDSAPNSDLGFRSYPSSTTRALEALTGSIKSPVERLVVRGVYRCLWASVIVRWAIFGKPDPLQVNFASTIVRDAAVPKLFLYSKGDNLVTSDEVERSIAKAKSLGTAVETYDFEESNHVSHFIHDSKTYELKVHDFLKRYEAPP